MQFVYHLNCIQVITAVCGLILLGLGSALCLVICHVMPHVITGAALDMDQGPSLLYQTRESFHTHSLTHKFVFLHVRSYNKDIYDRLRCFTALLC